LCSDVFAFKTDLDGVKEIEVRMAELLIEHGVSGDKVVLPEDVDFLKEQLGEPRAELPRSRS